MKRFCVFHVLLVGLMILSVAAFSVSAGDVPKKLKIAAVFVSPIENAWTASWIDSFERVKASKPEGLELDLDYSENIYGDKVVPALEAYAETGEYGIIWFHSSASDEVESIKAKYPDILFVVTGSGNRPLGDNAYLIYAHLHEPSYLLGIMAGSMTKSKILGVVGLFPADDVNDQIHAFRAGAQSVKADIKLKVSFIESWYDPAKAAEAANAQIAAGADFILQLGESFETCKQKNVYCFGNYVDLNSVAPEVIPTSTILNWDPQINYLIGQWREHHLTGKPYKAPMEKVWFSMAQGGSDIAPYHNFESIIPSDVKTRVAQARADIMSGKLNVKLDSSLPKSD
jgi:basic membrane lipoprotein Med (substrate-binding protein (PBP1-ABC) superfamily)